MSNDGPTSSSKPQAGAPLQTSIPITVNGHGGVARPPLGLAEPRLGDLGGFWTSFDKASDDHDKDMLDALKSSMDNLLIFAALFSAVNSAVLPFSIPMLSASTEDKSSLYLCLLAQQLPNSTVVCEAATPPPFILTHQVIRINQLFSVSLTFSLLAAFGALMGQQWITSYRCRPDGGFEEERRERQRRLLGAKRWQLAPVLELILPILLQVSLALFLIGLVQYLQSLDSRVALPNGIVAWLGAGLFFSTILFSLLDPYCPFKTPLSRIAWGVLRLAITTIHYLPEELRPTKPLRKGSDTSVADEVWMASSICRILETSPDPSILRDTALNIPLIQSKGLHQAIYSNDVALLHLYRLYEINATQGSRDESVYSTALCHLMLSSDKSDPERISHSLRFGELAVIFSVARAFIARTEDRRSHISLSTQDDLRSALPSHIMTIALAYILSQLDDGNHRANEDLSERSSFLNYLAAPSQLRATHDFHVAVMAWLLITSPDCLADGKRRPDCHQNLNFQYDVPKIDDKSTNGLFLHASEAYRSFYNPELPKSDDGHRTIPDGTLKCIVQALKSHGQATGVARTLLLGVLSEMRDMFRLGALLQQVTELEAVVGGLIPYLKVTSDREIRLAAARLALSIYKYSDHNGTFDPFGPNNILPAAKAWLKQKCNSAPTEEELESWLEDYYGAATS